MALIRNIPIVATGIEYPLETGPATFTEADLEDAVNAWAHDPMVKHPRMKLGHDPDSVWAYSGSSAEPNFGNFINLHLSDDRQEILADLETFDWLEPVLPIVYPSRSIEGAMGVTTASGKTWRLVIDAVSLLGVVLPGVKSLDDLRDVMVNPEVEVKVAASGTKKVIIKGQADLDDVRRAFQAKVATGEKQWWWIRSVRIDPNEVVAEDDETGTLFRLPFTVQDHDVEFGDPSQVVIEYRDKEVAAAGTPWLATWNTAASSREIKTKEKGMDPKVLRQKLGLPEDATDEQVTAKLDQLTASTQEPGADPNTQPPANRPAEADDKTPDEREREAADQNDQQTQKDLERTDANKEPVAARGAVLIDRDALAQLQAQAAQGVAARQRQIKDDDERYIMQDVIGKGKVPPARKDYWLKQLERDREGTRQYLDSLEENVIPVEARGASDIDTTREVVASGDDGGYPEWMLTPAERERVARHRAAQKGA